MDKKIERKFELKLFNLPLLSFNHCRLQGRNHHESQSQSTQIVSDSKAQKDKDKKPVFVINSLMLYRSFKLLTETANENLHAVTGSVTGRMRSLEQIIPLRLSVQNVGGAAAENQSLAEEFLNLYQFGMRPLGYFHSHPGCGISATNPSGTDRQTQLDMEQSGSEIIGAIFSRDGFIRFYANSHQPNVRVFGKRVKRIKKNVYKLEIEEDLQV
jgi:proteasome lid subunit RPN8/RPN11